MAPSILISKAIVGSRSRAHVRLIFVRQPPAMLGVAEQRASAELQASPDEAVRKAYDDRAAWVEARTAG